MTDPVVLAREAVEKRQLFRIFGTFSEKGVSQRHQNFSGYLLYDPCRYHECLGAVQTHHDSILMLLSGQLLTETEPWGLTFFCFKAKQTSPLVQLFAFSDLNQDGRWTDYCLLEEYQQEITWPDENQATINLCPLPHDGHQEKKIFQLYDQYRNTQPKFASMIAEQSLFLEACLEE